MENFNIICYNLITKTGNMRGVAMGGIAVILFIVLIIVLSVLQGESHERKIKEQIESMGGTVVNIEKKLFSTGPFMVVGKGRTVYRIEYRVGNNTREGWVRFGGLFGPDWRL
jgi:hypothetical protein